MLFLNVTNHSSGLWSQEQTDAALQYGQIVDMTFPLINPHFTDLEINELVEQYFSQIMDYKHPTVLLQGEYVFTFRLLTKLKAAGVKTVACISERQTNEVVLADGKTEKHSVFKFVCFREY